jgi:hypothetical protein
MVLDLPDYHQYFVSVTLPQSPSVGNPKKYEGSVAAAGTPETLPVNTDLGHNGRDGYIMNDGPGDLKIDVSHDGLTFEEDITVEVDEAQSLTGLSLHTVKIDATVSGTAYRALVI